MLSLVGLAIAAAFLAADWLRLSPAEADRRVISLEREQRRIRASIGVTLPGTPDLTALPQRLAEQGLIQGAPILMRIFKREFELELWMQREGVYHRFATYPICRWSGDLGPKLAQGDRQAPEGFYTIDRTSLNPNSRWYRSFNLGFPNAYDRAQGRTGSFLMVHGGCASVGCYAMTNAQMDEIWRLLNAALDAGQARVQVQIYPFRMTSERLARYQDHPAAGFWRELKAGHDLFEATLVPPATSVCRGHYVFGPGDPKSASPVDMPNRCTPASAQN